MQTIFIVISSILAMSSNSWIMIWVLMEINTLMMCTLISKDSLAMNTTNNTSLIYIMAQLLSSIIMMTSILCTNNNLILNTTMFNSMLIMKMGSPPFHYWYTKTLEKMKMSSNSMSIMMTWQKILPMNILMYSPLPLLTMLLSLLSLISPINKLKKKISFKSIMILSSINNNGWFLLSTLCSLFIMWSFFTIYSISLILTLNFFKKTGKKNSPISQHPWESMIPLFNLGGIPPSLNFLGKMLIIFSLINSQIPKELIIILMLISTLFLFHYTWSISENLSSNPLKSQINILKSTKIPFTISLFSILPIILMILGYTL